MKPLHKGLIIAAVHVLLVLSLGGKLLWDRAHYPRVWVRTVSFDPDLPIRGRYATLQLRVRLEGAPAPDKAALRYGYYGHDARLKAENGDLVAVADPNGSVRYTYLTRWNGQDKEPEIGPPILAEPVAFFLPEHAQDPSWRARGEELWAEVTVPRRGSPRPLRLAVKEASGTWRELNLR
jgi:hypothetical protein